MKKRMTIQEIESTPNPFSIKKAEYLVAYLNLQIEIASIAKERNAPITWVNHIGELLIIKQAVKRLVNIDDKELNTLTQDLASKADRLSRKNKAGRPKGKPESITARQEVYQAFRKHHGHNYDEYFKYCQTENINDEKTYTKDSFKKIKER